MNKENYIVYKHTFPNGKIYIGITGQEPERRWCNGNAYGKKTLVYKAIKKYKWENIKHEILFDNLNKISALMIEEDLIYYYKNIKNNSYNIMDKGGKGTEDSKRSEESRHKMSKSHKGLVTYSKYEEFSKYVIPGLSIKENLHIINANGMKISLTTLYGYYKRNNMLTKKHSDEDILSIINFSASIRKNQQTLKERGIEVSIGKLSKLMKSL